MAPSQYDVLEKSIHEVLKGGVTLSEEVENVYNNYLQQIFDIVVSKMEENPVFGALFGQKQYVGSYYEKLKIGMPDEYDIDFELHVQSFIGELQVFASDQPGFCQLKLIENTSPISDTQKADVKKKVMKWTDEEGFLSRSKVNQWMQSVVDKALGACQQNIFKFKRHTSGPAVTLVVTLTEDPNVRLSVDFVPVFVFEGWPNIEDLREWAPEMKVEKWYVVPKSINSDKDFRLSFWHQEKHLLCDTNQMKPVLKLIKKLRDVQQWKGFSSYYIKTMFLWKTAANGKSYWQKSMGETLIEMLKEMRNYLLEQKSLPFFWVEEYDLLSQLDPMEKQNIGGYLDNMIEDIMNNLDTPGYIKKYFIPPVRCQPFEDNSVIENTLDDFIISSGAFEENEWDLAPASSSSYREYSQSLDRPQGVGAGTIASYRSVRDDSQSLARPQEVGAGTIAAIAVGTAAIAAVGLFALFGASRRSRQ